MSDSDSGGESRNVPVDDTVYVEHDVGTLEQQCPQDRSKGSVTSILQPTCKLCHCPTHLNDGRRISNVVWEKKAFVSEPWKHVHAATLYVEESSSTTPKTTAKPNAKTIVSVPVIFKVSEKMKELEMIRILESHFPTHSFYMPLVGTSYNRSHTTESIGARISIITGPCVSLLLKRGPADLFTYIENNKKMDLSIIRIIMRQLVLALGQLHRINMAHLDLSPENILFDTTSQAVTLIDWECARILDPRKAVHFDGQTEIKGKPYYITLERVNRLPWNGFEADVFALGTICFLLLFRTHPYKEPGDVRYQALCEEQWDRIFKSQKVCPTDARWVDPIAVECIDFISYCCGCLPNKTNAMNASDIQHYFCH